MNTWKRMTAALLAASLISSCDTAAPESTASQTAPEETAEASAQPETEPAAAVRGQGGTPWTDYDLKENISADITLSPKDDLYYSVNKDLLVQSEAGLFHGRMCPAARYRRYQSSRLSSMDSAALISCNRSSLAVPVMI